MCGCASGDKMEPFEVLRALSRLCRLSGAPCSLFDLTTSLLPDCIQSAHDRRLVLKCLESLQSTNLVQRADGLAVEQQLGRWEVTDSGWETLETNLRELKVSEIARTARERQAAQQQQQNCNYNGDGVRPALYTRFEKEVAESIVILDLDHNHGRVEDLLSEIQCNPKLHVFVCVSRGYSYKRPVHPQWHYVACEAHGFESESDVRMMVFIGGKLADGSWETVRNIRIVSKDRIFAPLVPILKEHLPNVTCTLE
eukprot:ANDGO_08286.mRNA.1 hypothetical protein